MSDNSVKAYTFAYIDGFLAMLETGIGHMTAEGTLAIHAIPRAHVRIGAAFGAAAETGLALIEIYNNPSPDQMENLQRAAIAAWTGIMAGEVGGLAGVGAVTAGAALIGVAVSPVALGVGAVLGAGVLSAAASKFGLGNYAYGGYKWLQQHAVDLILSHIDVIPSDSWHFEVDPFRSLYDEASVAGQFILGCPLILDLDGDGVETTDVKEGAYFDHDGNGFSQLKIWQDIDGDGYSASDELVTLTEKCAILMVHQMAEKGLRLSRD